MVALLRGRTVTIALGRSLPGPPEVVWRLITDWERQGDWMLEARDFRVLSQQRTGVGVEAEATVTIAGITVRDRVRVTAWEPQRRLAIRHLGWVSGDAELVLTAEGGSTYLFWRESLNPPLGPLGALGLTLLRPVMARVFRRDLDVLAGLVRDA